MANKRRLSRRALLKTGLAGGGAALLSAKATRPTWAQTGSPATTPFVDELPIPPIAQPALPLTGRAAGMPFRAFAPAPNPAAHQRYAEFAPQKFYDITIVEAEHRFHRDLPPSRIWGYNGISPGPTFIERYDVPILVRFRNNLPANHIGFGVPSVITHLHNSHTASESDGFPLDFYEVGQYKDHHYPNILAGYDAFPPRGDERETLGTLFYHDHRIDFTAPNVYRGLSGFYLLFDERDSGDERDPNPRAFRLPSGAYDVPLLFADKRFTADGQLFFDQFDLNGFIGDKFTVNGKIQPYFKVARRKYRFRLLNGGPARFYEFFLSNGQQFTQIGHDGNLLPAPLTRESIRLGVAERADVIVDFSRARIGEQIILENRLQQTSGRGPGNVGGTPTPILRFEVERDAEDPSQVPEKLRDLPPVDQSEAVTTRTWNFGNQNGAWRVNGRLFDSARVDATIKKGTAEIWTLSNGRGWSHPVHIHFEEFQILSRNNGAAPADEVARKDVVRLAPGNQVRLFMRFRDFTGRYVMHCHNMMHEDHAMMIWFEIVP
jgi:FtsP/CotA-like multicopper oxidase with cupredoxin domain